MLQFRVIAAAGVLAAGLLAGSASAAVTVADNYYGGINTYTGQDVIGNAAVFDIQSAVFERVGPAQSTLRVTINTNYAGVPGTPAALTTGYGALFITPGTNAWNVTGVAPYPNDVYTPGEWDYAFTMPLTGAIGSSGTSSLYDTSDGAVVLSNVNGNSITFPNPGNGGYYFRQDQAVQFTPGVGATALAGGAWAVSAGQIRFDINDNGLLGNNFAFSYAMTCANDVIQGQVAIPVPEPATWAMMLMGFMGLGSAARVSRRRAALQA